MKPLDPVRELLPDADHWCQFQAVKLLPDNTKAYCLTSAMVCGYMPRNIREQAAKLAQEKGHKAVYKFNDVLGREFSEIQQFIDELEARLESAA